MLPLSHWPHAARRQLLGVFTDIDDTLTTDGAITADALQALDNLRAAGLVVIAVTGRPVGWSEPFARSWPVDAIVAENGAVALCAVRTAGQQASESARGFPLPLRRLYRQDEATRRANFARMQAVAARVLREVPSATLARDSHGRETDIAIDHSEFSQLPPAQIAQVLGILDSEDMNASVSSIHINAWYGEHNKWVGARWIVRELLGRDLSTETGRWAFVGDSTNDQLMFEAFTHSVGVANIACFADQLTHAPRYVSAQARGAGFAEVAAAVLAARA